MKTLTSYKKNGFDFTLIKRIENIGLFCGVKPGSNFANWEVIKIKSHDGISIGGNDLPAAEYAPSNNEWGMMGWTFTRSEPAMEKIQQLLEAEKNQAK